jgi:peptidoglycan/LPS O-acetylase OafA/YrhL
MPQLDSLRAIAVGGVLLRHFWPSTARVAETGFMGVHLFFVLSGFLITGILLKSRAAVDAEIATAGFSLRRFYLRRFLRIFPLYYAVLLIAWLTDVPGARGAMAWHLSYLTNIHNFLMQTTSGRMAPYWSLAVEEQFYLIWPWVVLFAPVHRLPSIVLGAVAAAPIFRLAVLLLTGNDQAPILPISCLDSLGLGAYIAMASSTALAGHRLVRPIGRRAVLAGLALFGVYQVALWIDTALVLRLVVFNLAIALPSAWVIERAARGFGGWPGRVLMWAPLRWVGRISYGLYVVHLLLPYLLPWAAKHLGARGLFDALGNGEEVTVWYLVFYTAASVAVAAVSWYAFERPINRLKDRFEYRVRLAAEA